MNVDRFAKAAALMCAAALLMTGPTRAQTQAPPVRAAVSPDRLPIKRVVLYKSGVGYFEHVGRVRGNQAVTIDFTSGQLDDVLKSLTTLDLDGGRVAGISYNSEAGIDRRLGALRLPIGAETTRAQFLTALRGARLEVQSASRRVVGRLLSVETVERASGNATSHVDVVSIMSDGGELQTVALDPGVSVRILEADLNQEVGRYLSLLSSTRDQDLRRMTIATTGTGDRDLFVSYVSETPVWKATYRLVLPSAVDARKPLLQGWAIVDNTVGQDWDNVQLSLVAGAPQSFVQHISQPYYVQRPIVPLPAYVSLAPQMHQGALGTGGMGALTGTVTDAQGGVIPGVSVRVTRNGARVTDAATDAAGRYRVATLTPGSYDVNFTLQGFRSVVRSNVDVTGGMETVLNTTLTVGSAAESVTISAAAPMASPAPAPVGRAVGGVGRGGGGGFGGAAELAQKAGDLLVDRIDAARSAQLAEASAAQLGDLFEYTLGAPVTIRKNQSALVPILSGDVTAEKVSLWNPSTGTSRPLRAVWITNSTGLTLDAGSFTVVEGQAFTGEGLMESLKAGERRLLSYALDLGVVVDAKGETVPSRVTRVQIARGAIIQQTEERQRRVYTARNEDAEARVVVIEHPARAGWTVGGGATPIETTPAWHRFRVSVAPKTTATFTVEETHPLQTQYSISSITDDQVALLVREQAITGPVAAALREVLARKAEIARLTNEVSVRQREIEQIGRDQDRVRENMKSLKGSSEEKQLLQRYVKQLDDQENRLDVLRREAQALTDQRQKAQADLNTFIERLGVISEAPAPAGPIPGPAAAAARTPPTSSAPIDRRRP